MITADVESQGLVATEGFPEGANENRQANSNVEPGIYIAVLEQKPMVYQSPTLANARYILVGEFEKKDNGELGPKTVKDAAGKEHICVRQAYPSLFNGEFGTIIVDPNNTENQVGIGPRVHPTGEAAELFNQFPTRNASFGALFGKCHQDSTKADHVTHVIKIDLENEVWTINRNRGQANANQNRHVQRRVYRTTFVQLKTPVKVTR